MLVVRDGLLRFGTCLEISEGGLLFSTEDKYLVGDAVEINLFLSNGSFIVAHGVVGYVIDRGERERKVGVKYVGLTPATQDKIREFVGLAAE